MADEPNDPLPPEPEDRGDSLPSDMRLVPLSDIDAFVTVRAGAIVDEAAILCIQFLGGGDRDRSRREFVDLCMAHFDETAEKYDLIKMLTAAKRRQAMARQLARARAMDTAEAAQQTQPPEPDKKD